MSRAAAETMMRMIEEKRKRTDKVLLKPCASQSGCRGAGVKQSQRWMTVTGAQTSDRWPGILPI